MHSDILDKEIEINEPNSYTEIIAWWKNRRLKYALTILLSSIFFLSINTPEHVSKMDIVIIIVAWFIGANIFYCAGWGLEIFEKHYSKKFNIGNNLLLDLLKKHRTLTFVGGLLFSILVTSHQLGLILSLI